MKIYKVIKILIKKNPITEFIKPVIVQYNIGYVIMRRLTSLIFVWQTRHSELYLYRPDQIKIFLKIVKYFLFSHVRYNTNYCISIVIVYLFYERV